MLRDDLPPLPDRMRGLKTDARGYPVPWFVAWEDGKPDFRVIRSRGIAIAHNRRLCWLCGQPRGKYGAFVIGPMCAINRVSSEPPSHLQCAKFAATACPFLTRPMAKRNARDLPDEIKEPAGVGLKRNPGVALVWVTDRYEPFSTGDGGHLFEIGPASSVYWFAEGREATRAEVMASIDSGMPLLREPAEAEGPEAVAALERMTIAAMALVPPLPSEEEGALK